MLLKIIISFLIFISSFSHAESLDNEINKVLNENIDISQRLNIAIAVNELHSGKEIYSSNPYQFMIPASTTKLLTAYAALDFLGPDFIYKTSISFDKKKINSGGTLNGDLHIKFEGDPSFTLKDFANLWDKLKLYNINLIKGNVIIDDLVFDQSYQADGWPWDDAKFCFGAPTSAVVINKNCFYLNLSASKKIGNISNLTGFSVAKLNNQVISKDNRGCTPELKAYADNKYDLTGCLDIKSPKILLKIAYQNPRRMLIDLIKKKNIVEGKIIFQSIPKKYRPIIEHKSASLSELVKYMVKNSENIYADNFLKTIGAKYYNLQGSFSNGTKAVLEIIKNQAIKIFDGSGGSTYNLIAPDHFIKLLNMAYKNHKIWPYFYDALPISGKDGTLKERLLNLQGVVRAKTGGIRSVSNLVGFIEKENKEPLIFAIMINGSSNSKASVDLIDKILTIIADNS